MSVIADFYEQELKQNPDASLYVSGVRGLTEETVKKYKRKYSADELKWSYADSPYCGYGYDKYFQKLNKAFSERMKNISDDEYGKEIDYWLSLMEKVMKKLDDEKVFGEGKERRSMIINAEIMPPDETNAERAFRLNEKNTYKKWYSENFEDEEAVSAEFYEMLSKMSRAEIVSAIRDMTPAELEATEKYLVQYNKDHPINEE